MDYLALLLNILIILREKITIKIIKTYSSRIVMLKDNFKMKMIETKGEIFYPVEYD